MLGREPPKSTSTQGRSGARSIRLYSGKSFAERVRDFG
jgi:hypothetical protein